MSYSGPWRLETPPTIGPLGNPVLNDAIRKELANRAKGHRKCRMAREREPIPQHCFEEASKLVVGAAVRVKGRLKRLQEMMPGILMQEGVRFGFVIIDYKCPEGTGDWVRENVTDPRVLLVSADPDHDLFCYSHAWNVGIRHIDADVVLAIDVDLKPIVGDFFLESLARMLADDCYWSTNNSGAHMGAGGAGTTFFYKWLWEELNGYSEVIDAFTHGAPVDAQWGGEDGDMWGRCGRANSCHPGRSCKFRGKKNVKVFGKGGKTYERKGPRANKWRRAARETEHIWVANWGKEPGQGRFKLWSPGLGDLERADLFWERIRVEAS